MSDGWEGTDSGRCTIECELKELAEQIESDQTKRGTDMVMGRHQGHTANMKSCSCSTVLSSLIKPSSSDITVVSAELEALVRSVTVDFAVVGPKRTTVDRVVVLVANFEGGRKDTGAGNDAVRLCPNFDAAGRWADGGAGRVVEPARNEVVNGARDRTTGTLFEELVVGLDSVGRVGGGRDADAVLLADGPDVGTFCLTARDFAGAACLDGPGRKNSSSPSSRRQ